MLEEEAIAVLREGDPAGLESLVERHQLEALRTALIITGDRPTAEDVVEEAFVKVFQRIRQFKRGAPFAPWFYRIVVNEALSATRRRRLLAPLSPASDTRPDPAPGPDQLAEVSELQASLLAAVRELSVRRRQDCRRVSDRVRPLGDAGRCGRVGLRQPQRRDGCEGLHRLHHPRVLICPPTLTGARQASPLRVTGTEWRV